MPRFRPKWVMADYSLLGRYSKIRLPIPKRSSRPDSPRLRLQSFGDDSPHRNLDLIIFWAYWIICGGHLGFFLKILSARFGENRFALWLQTFRDDAPHWNLDLINFGACWVICGGHLGCFSENLATLLSARSEESSFTHRLQLTEKSCHQVLRKTVSNF